MAERSVVVNLIARVGGFVAGMNQAAASTTRLGAAAQQNTARARGLTGALGGVSGILGGALLIGVGGMVKGFADFEEKMSAVRANVHGSDAEFRQLTEAVKTQGTQFGFTATQSADAANDLAKAGLSATQIIGGGLVGALTLAAAGGVSTGDAAETAATAMSMFALNSSQIPHIADLLAAGADRSTASVSSLSEGLMEGGSLAHLMGVSIEDTTAILAEFDQSGLKGAKAGNALKTMFQNLLDPTAKQAETMDELGLSFFNASGQFIGLSAMAGQLQDKLGGLDDKSRNAALSVLFGARSVQAANILYKDGAKGVEEWQKSVNDSGFAAKNAAAKMDNLNGDLRKLVAALQSDFIEAGTGANGVLRGIVQTLTAAVTGVGLLLQPVGQAAAAFSKLPGPIQEAAFALGTLKVAQRLFGGQLVAGQARVGSYIGSLRQIVTAQGGIVRAADGSRVAMGRFGSAIQQAGQHVGTVARMQQTFLNVSSSASRLPRTMGLVSASMVGLRGAAGGLIGALGGPWGLAITGGVMALSAWISHTQGAKAAAQQYKSEVDNLTRTLDENTGAITSNTRAEAFKGLQDSGAVDIARKYGINLRDMTDAVLGSAPALARFNEQVAGAKGMAAFSDQAGVTNGDMKKLTESVGHQTGAVKDSQQAWKDAKAAGVEAGQAADEAGTKGASAADKQKQAAQEAADALEELVKGYKDVGSAAMAQSDSQLGFNKAILDANKAIKDNGKSTNLMTEKGQANRQALLGLASATTKYASDLVNNTGDQKAANAILAQGRKELIAHAEKMGYNAAEAKKMADEWLPLSKLHADVDVSGVDGAIFKLDKMGNVILTLQGKKVTIPADTPNAEHVAAVLYSVRDAALSANGKSVKIPTSAIDSPETMRNLKGIKGARENADGSVTIPTSALNAAETTRLLGLLGRVAVDADGKEVIIPASTPNAAKVAELINNIHGAQIKTNGKKVVISTSAPLAVDTRGKIDKIKGAAVSADGKRVTIDTSAPGAVNAYNQILAALRAAQSKTVRITTIYQEQHVGDNLARHGRGFARGGIVDHGIQRMASGGLRQAMFSDRPILWGEAGLELYAPLAKDSRAPRAIRLIGEGADFYGYQLIPKGARRAADGWSSWRDARPVASSNTVVVQGNSGGGGGLSNADRALLREAITELRRQPQLVAAGAKAGIEGKSRVDAQSAHLAGRRGGF